MKNIYSILDVVAKEFGPIFEASNDDVARRRFTSTVADSPYCNEFQLIRIGNYEIGLHKKEIIATMEEDLENLGSDLTISKEKIEEHLRLIKGEKDA